MPGLKILTVKSKNGDSSHAGEYLFNGRGVHGIFGSDGDVHLLFSANKVEGGIVYDDYLVDESVSDVTGVLGSYGINGATDTYYIEVFDVGAGTVIKGFSAKDIMMGVDDRNGNAL